jgi:hypothetical protein
MVQTALIIIECPMNFGNYYASLCLLPGTVALLGARHEWHEWHILEKLLPADSADEPGS